jgi:UDP-N-acetylmuramate: L-alanyl-gamma-D-glutamyl-meso-diaminopimelate ligase
MHQLAIALKNKGYQVSGSDDEIFEPALSNLKKEGLLPSKMGWYPENIDNQIDAVILGMHAREDNPELVKARQLGLPIYSFPEYIFQESKNKKRIVVGGSHGKTTTTAMIMHVLQETNLQFDWLVGAKLEGFSQSVQITDAPIIVCEGDEYPASAIEKRPKFHFLFPDIAIITGIAWDHINVFTTFEMYLEQFRIFISKIEPGGLLIYNQSDLVLNKLVTDLAPGLRCLPYAIPAHRIENGKTYVKIGGREGALSVFGDHNLLNLQAAWLVCSELGIEAEQFLQSMESFKGASKRLELLAKNERTNIYRDFAHAPSKVKATMRAVKEQFPSRKLIAVLELHTYSSLNQAFLKEYKGSMKDADQAMVYFSKHALELKKLPPLSPETIAREFDNTEMIVLNEKADLEKWLRKQSYENANLLLMSSGNYDGVDMINLAHEIAGNN